MLFQTARRVQNQNSGNQSYMNSTLKAILLSAGLCSLQSVCLGQSIVYDNLNAPDLGQQYTSNFEFGDQVRLTGTDRIMSGFTFYSILNATSAGTQTATLRLYANTGVNPPTTPFYTFNPILLETGSHGYSVTFTNPVTVLPDEFTWTVEFSNLGAGQSAGLLLYGPPSVGSSFDDFWQKDGAGVWSLNRINGGATLADFAAQITAVPEPSVLVLGSFGALLLAGLKRFRKASG